MHSTHWLHVVMRLPFIKQNQHSLDMTASDEIQSPPPVAVI